MPGGLSSRKSLRTGPSGPQGSEDRDFFTETPSRVEPRGLLAVTSA